MNIELAVTGITEANRRTKLMKAVYALSRHMGLNPQVSAPWLAKAKTHKYVSRVWKDGRWEYEYPKTENERRANTARQIKDVITGIEPLRFGADNAEAVGLAYLKDMAAYLRDNEVRARWLQNRRVDGIDAEHLTHKMARPRD